MSKDKINNTSKGEVVIYKSPEGDTNLEVTLEEEKVWLSQAQLVNLFKTTKQNVSLHINNIFMEEELDRKSTVKEYLTTAIIKPTTSIFSTFLPLEKIKSLSS